MFAYVSPRWLWPLVFCNHVPCFPLYQFVFTAPAFSHWWIICCKHGVQIKGRSQTNDRLRIPSAEKGISNGPPNSVISRKQLVTFEEHFQASGYGRASTVKAKHGVWREELKDAGVRCPFREVGREKKSSKTEWQMFCGSLTKVVKEFLKRRQVCCFEMLGL